jgi:hypothetical protein
MVRRPKPVGLGHNGGPPLKEKPHVPPWGRDGIGTYFFWKKAHEAAWRPASTDILLSRQAKAEALGLTYAEYTLEILERGIHLQAEDVDKIAAIKARRKSRVKRPS